MDYLSDPTFLKAFAVVNIIWLGLFAGVALGLYLFCIPVIEQSPSTAIMLRQFRQTVCNSSLGLRFGFHDYFLCTPYMGKFF
jgi:hypothetical protein